MNAVSKLDLSKKRVLLVEDMVSMRNIERELMHKMGIKYIDEAVNGTDAIKRLKSLRYDLVICACAMPDLSGLAVLKFIRASAEGVQLPFLMVANSISAEDSKQALKLGMNDYLEQPLQQDLFRSKVLKLLS